MSRRFELLKDLPDAKAGTILTLDGGVLYDYKSRDGQGSWYFAQYVENNPAWFKEIKDTEQSSGEWEWTDELVKEFRMFVGKFSVSHDGAIPAFKKYKNGENFLWAEQSSKPFEWTDELVDEYALRMEKESLTVESFKRLKQPTANDVLNTEEKTSRRLAHEQIYARKRKEIGGIFHLTEKTSWITYVFFSPVELSIEQKDKIKSLIEKVINNE